MAKSELLSQIRDELKRTVRLLMVQLHREHPTESLYTVMFEADVRGTYAIRIAGSEESLSRLAEKYVFKGQVTVKSSHPFCSRVTTCQQK